MTIKEAVDAIIKAASSIPTPYGDVAVPTDALTKIIDTIREIEKLHTWSKAELDHWGRKGGIGAPMWWGIYKLESKLDSLGFGFAEPPKTDFPQGPYWGPRV